MEDQKELDAKVVGEMKRAIKMLEKAIESPAKGKKFVLMLAHDTEDPQIETRSLICAMGPGTFFSMAIQLINSFKADNGDVPGNVIPFPDKVVQ